MKTITQRGQVQISASIPEIRKINERLLRPLKAGFLGFTTILMIIFFINLFSYILGTTEKFGMDVLDLLLAAVGFLLQSTGALIKSFVR